MTDQIYPVKFEDEFRICPECGYKDGFHTMLQQDKNQERGKVSWLFICPSCHKIFDIGASVSLFSD